jgi:hypothetical protein
VYKGKMEKHQTWKSKAQRAASDTGKKSKEHRDFPDSDEYGNRRAVCKRCHAVMNDIEPSNSGGEFFHPSHDKLGKPYKCINAGKMFTTKNIEIEPFIKKSIRRKNKRLAIRP